MFHTLDIPRCSPSCCGIHSAEVHPLFRWSGGQYRAPGGRRPPKWWTSSGVVAGVGAKNGGLGPKLSPTTLVRLCYKDDTCCWRQPVPSSNIKKHQILLIGALICENFQTLYGEGIKEIFVDCVIKMMQVTKGGLHHFYNVVGWLWIKHHIH